MTSKSGARSGSIMTVVWGEPSSSPETSEGTVLTASVVESRARFPDHKSLWLHDSLYLLSINEATKLQETAQFCLNPACTTWRNGLCGHACGFLNPAWGASKQPGWGRTTTRRLIASCCPFWPRARAFWSRFSGKLARSTAGSRSILRRLWTAPASSLDTKPGDWLEP
jgi:hypothetical protein